MIQLSTPIQTASPVQIGVHETEGVHVEDLSDDSSGHLGQAEKENGPGIFAKLLESLAAKNKAAESEDAEDAGDKLLSEADLTNTSNQLMPEHMTLSIEQTTEQTIGLTFEESSDLSIEQTGDLSIAPLFEPGIWAGAEKTLMPDDSESISGEINLMEALLARDHAAKQAGAEQVEEEEAPKGRELVRPGDIPGEMALKDEGPVENEGLSVAAAPPEQADEAQAIKAKANEETAKLADKKARSLMADSSRQTEEDISRLKYQTASPGAKPAGENGEGRRGNSAAAESRKKGRERINVEFLDLRTEGPTETGNVRGLPVSAQGQTPQKSEFEIQVDLNPKTANSEAGKAGGETYQGRAFEDALAAQLRGNLSADIVRDATVIARNGGEGTIRLTLHPASLGNVKVRLEMAENKITGLIVVESDEALRAFQRELPVLEKAFKDSGFSETNLQMSLAQDERNYGGREDRRERDFSALAPVMAASRYDSDSEWIETLLPIQGETVLSAWPERIPVNLLI